MTGICVVVIVAAALAGCASSGTTAAGGTGGTKGTGSTTSSSTAPATPTGQPTSSSAAAPSSSAQDSASSQDSSLDQDPFGILTQDPTSSSVALPPATAPWTPQGDLANPLPVSTVVNADKSMTATWPEGAPPAHALTVKLRAARNGTKIVISLFIDNESGQQVSMNEGLFTNGEVLDANGNTLNAETFDSAWTLGSGSADGNIHPGQPLVGNFVVDAPASGSVLNAYWSQAVMANGIMSGVILMRNIPIN